MNDEDSEFQIEISTTEHIHLAPLISKTMEESAQARGTGIAKRSVDALVHHILEGNAIIAIHKSECWAGFCYLASWDNGLFVSNSGLICCSSIS